MLNLDKIEKRFTEDKSRLIKQLETVERRKREDFSQVSKELDKYKKREALLKRLESQTSRHLEQINKKINNIRRQDAEDKRAIVRMENELHRLRREIPTLQRLERKIRPERNSIANHEIDLLKRYHGLSAKVRQLEAKKTRVQNELTGITKKEGLLRQGRIYWTLGGSKIVAKTKVVQKRRTTRNARPTRVHQKQGLFQNIMFGKS